MPPDLVQLINLRRVPRLKKMRCTSTWRLKPSRCCYKSARDIRLLRSDLIFLVSHILIINIFFFKMENKLVNSKSKMLDSRCWERCNLRWAQETARKWCTFMIYGRNVSIAEREIPSGHQSLWVSTSVLIVLVSIVSTESDTPSWGTHKSYLRSITLDSWSRK